MIKKCIVCGIEFKGSNNSKYCSDNCRNSKVPTSLHVGEHHNELTIKSAYRQKSILYCNCECSCGELCTVRYDCIINGNTKSCGHINENNIFKAKSYSNCHNKYNVISIDEINSEELKCICPVCKKEYLIKKENFYNSKSCGCLGYEQRKKNMEAVRKRINVQGSNIINVLNCNKPSKANKSGTVGVSWDKRRKKWIAQITFQGYNYRLGRYDLIDDAVSARHAAEDALFGNFINFYKENYPSDWEYIMNKRNTSRKKNEGTEEK